jgi:opacity protein-like surface antigen
MRHNIAVASLSLLLAASLTGTAGAQRRRGLVDVSSYSGGRHGFWANFGIGAGSESFKFDDTPCSSRAGSCSYTSGLVKPAYSIRMGGTVNPNFRLGAELSGWADRHYDSQAQDNVTSYLGGLMLVGQFYPSQRAGFFLKGGVGVTRSGEDLAGPGGDLHEDGFGYTVGAGYEIKLSRNLAITPTIDLLQHRSQSRDQSGVLQPALHDRLLTFGVALTVQSGR